LILLIPVPTAYLRPVPPVQDAALLEHVPAVVERRAQALVLDLVVAVVDARKMGVVERKEVKVVVLLVLVVEERRPGGVPPVCWVAPATPVKTISKAGRGFSVSTWALVWEPDVSMVISTCW
jgi:hypothetical protein